MKSAWHKRLHTEYVWGPLAAHFAAIILVGSTLLLSANYFCADDSTIHREDATVVSKETHKRHHSRRIGRRRYTTGEPYYVYDLNLQFATVAPLSGDVRMYSNCSTPAEESATTHLLY